MRKTVPTLFILGAVGLIVLVSLYLWSSFNRPTYFRIIQQKPGDTHGRTLIYHSLTPGVFSGTEGKGYIVGSFQGWQAIPNSSDQYLLVYRPSDQTTATYRLALAPRESSSGDQPAEAALQANLRTHFSVEDLSAVKSGKGPADTLNGLGFLYQTPDLLPKILTKDDVVVLRLERPEGTIIKDENRVIIVPWLTLRRWGGKKAL